MVSPSLLYLNARGLILLTDKTKLTKIGDIAAFHNSVMIGITETHLGSHHHNVEANINGYQCVRSDRPSRTNGGVALYVQNSFKIRLLLSTSNNVCDALVVLVRELDSIVIVFYRPPDSSREEFLEVLNKTDEIVEKIKDDIMRNQHIILMGDFNFPSTKWENDQQPSGQADEAVQTNDLLQFTDKWFMQNHIKTPTRYGNILDLVFTSNDSSINGYDTIVDHDYQIITL